MRRLIVTALFALALLQSASALDFVLVDGSVLSGSLEGKIRIETVFGTFDLDGGLVIGLVPGSPAKVQLKDGSTIVGTIVSGVLPLRWRFGVMEIQLADIRSVRDPARQISEPTPQGVVSGVPSTTTTVPKPTGTAVAVPRNVIGRIQFTAIPGGQFDMGDGSLGAESDEKPVRRIRISPFLMSTYEITVDDFERFVQATGYMTDSEQKGESLTWKDPGFPQEGLSPVTCVSWNDATVFCSWFSAAHRVRTRLPTEAEWEYAARGGEAGWKYPTGDMVSVDLANYDWNKLNRTTPVGTYPANPFGLYDLAGNVAEWCQDWYGVYDYHSSIDPKGFSLGSDRVVRGGSWFTTHQRLRVTYRGYASPGSASNDRGFRIVVER